jgi:hypothetical protein
VPLFLPSKNTGLHHQPRGYWCHKSAIPIFLYLVSDRALLTKHRSPNMTKATFISLDFRFLLSFNFWGRVTLEVLTAAVMKSSVFKVTTPYSPL